MKHGRALACGKSLLVQETPRKEKSNLHSSEAAGGAAGERNHQRKGSGTVPAQGQYAPFLMMIILIIT